MSLWCRATQRGCRSGSLLPPQVKRLVNSSELTANASFNLQSRRRFSPSGKSRNHGNEGTCPGVCLCCVTVCPSSRDNLTVCSCSPSALITAASSPFPRVSLRSSCKLVQSAVNERSSLIGSSQRDRRPLLQKGSKAAFCLPAASSKPSTNDREGWHQKGFRSPRRRARPVLLTADSAL